MQVSLSDSRPYVFVLLFFSQFKIIRNRSYSWINIRLTRWYDGRNDIHLFVVSLSLDCNCVPSIYWCIRILMDSTSGIHIPINLIHVKKIPIFDMKKHKNRETSMCYWMYLFSYHLFWVEIIWLIGITFCHKTLFKKC